MLDMQRREAGDEVVPILIGLQGENPACIRRDDDQRMDPGSQHAFGEEVAKLVEEVTDDKSLPKDERKRLQIEEAPNKSDRAKILKLADKISNLRDIAASPPPDWSVKRRLEYVHWARSVAQGLTGVSEGLEQEFDQAAKEAEHSAAVTR